jgi:hypothetical protein
LPSAALNKHCICPPRIVVNDPPTPLFYNSEQCYTDTCPEGFTGDPIEVCVAAGVHSSEVDQATANAAALASAQAQAEALRVATPCIPGEAVTSSTCRSTAVTATLIGCSEFTGFASIPPRKYRRFEANGVGVLTFYVQDDTCSVRRPLTDIVQCTSAKWLQYDSLTGATTTGGATDCIDLENPLDNPTHDDSPLTCYGGGLPASDCAHIWTGSATQLTRTSTGACCTNQIETGSLVNLLLDEDTEEDAEARALIAAAPVVWTSEDCATAVATRELRGAGDFDFTSTIIETQVTIGSIGQPLIIGGDYDVTITLARRLTGSGNPFVDYADIEFTITASDVTEVSDWVRLLNTAGYDTKITAVEAVYSP